VTNGSERTNTQSPREQGRQLGPTLICDLDDIFDGFGKGCQSADVRFCPLSARTQAGHGKRCVRLNPRDSRFQTGLELCATNSPIMNGLPSNRCCQTSRVAFLGVNDRRVLNGIFWILRSGAPWRDLPEAFGPYTTCYNRFVRWRRAGVWGRIIDALATAQDATVQMIDTSIVRVHQHGACITRNQRQSMGRSRGG
jgi:transposase